MKLNITLVRNYQTLSLWDLGLDSRYNIDRVFTMLELNFSGQLQVIQARLPHSLDSDILMANCAWEYVLQWNKDIEVSCNFVYLIYIQFTCTGPRGTKIH